MDFNFEELQENWIVNYFGLKKYTYIINELRNVVVSTDIDNYQKTFNSFYVVRRGKKWRKNYYDYLEKNKNNPNLEFKDVIRELYKKTGNVEASFSSKLLATINPKMPIWDQYVLKNLNLKLKGKTKDEKIDNAIALYDDMIEIYKELLKREDVQKIIQQFNSIVKEYKIEDAKILDFIFWSKREITNYNADQE